MAFTPGWRQLPEGVKHCKIIFRECEKGHGRLIASNWVDHGCLFCKLAELEGQLEEEMRFRKGTNLCT